MLLLPDEVGKIKHFISTQPWNIGIPSKSGLPICKDTMTSRDENKVVKMPATLTWAWPQGLGERRCRGDGNRPCQDDRLPGGTT